MPTIHDADRETLLKMVGHFADCGSQAREWCQNPVHEWDLGAWTVVLDRLDLYGWWFATAEQEDKRRLTLAVFRVVSNLARNVDRERRKAVTQNTALRDELAQQANGARLRTHEEILAAASRALAMVARPGVSARQQYAAARVAEALRWVLEAPLGETKTGFHPERDPGIA